MSLSSNSLSHFTSFSNLKSIIQTKCLYPRYCFEKVLNLDFVVTYPLLSFTDIPMDQIYDHAIKYGSSGIGFNKNEWGIEIGKRNKQIINPVFYITENSQIIDFFKKILLTYYKHQKSALEINNKEKEILQSFFNALGLYKITEGLEWDKKAKRFKSETVPFYNEREWRYLPNMSEDQKDVEGIPLNFSPVDDFYDEFGTFKYDHFESKNKEIEKHKLDFTVSDIDYIVIEDKAMMSEITEVIYFSYSKDESENLIKKIKLLNTLKPLI
jgi:hypothetical protein